PWAFLEEPLVVGGELARDLAAVRAHDDAVVDQVDLDADGRPIAALEDPPAEGEDVLLANHLRGDLADHRAEPIGPDDVFRFAVVHGFFSVVPKTLECLPPLRFRSRSAITRAVSASTAFIGRITTLPARWTLTSNSLTFAIGASSGELVGGLAAPPGGRAQFFLGLRACNRCVLPAYPAPLGGLADDELFDQVDAFRMPRVQRVEQEHQFVERRAPPRRIVVIGLGLAPPAPHRVDVVEHQLRDALRLAARD